MPNALTRHVGLNAGTWVVETLVKHYFEHAFGDRKAPRTNGTDSVSGNLRQDELLYDEVFNIVKVSHIVRRVNQQCPILFYFSHSWTRLLSEFRQFSRTTRSQYSFQSYC